jgi:hypothetical protein
MTRTARRFFPIGGSQRLHEPEQFGFHLFDEPAGQPEVCLLRRTLDLEGHIAHARTPEGRRGAPDRVGQPVGFVLLTRGNGLLKLVHLRWHALQKNTGNALEYLGIAARNSQRPGDVKHL